MERLTDVERAKIDGVLVGIANFVGERAMQVIGCAVDRMYQLEREQSINNCTHYDKHHICVEFASARYGVTLFEDLHTQDCFRTKLIRDKSDLLIETCRKTGKTTEKTIDNSTNEAGTND